MRSIYLFVIAWILTAGVGVAMVIDGPSPIWWIGAGLILATSAHALTVAAPTLTRAWAWLSRPRTLAKTEYHPSTVLTEVAIFIGFLALAAVIMPEAALGDRPIDHDHTVHYTKAWRLQHHFLSQGRLIGWSDSWFAGYPAQYLYPIGADLWIILVNALSFGLLGLSAAYAVGVYLVWALQGWSVYLFARAGFSRVTGVLAGALLMSDTGAFRFGGWVYTMEWAVWPQTLAMAFMLIALAKLPTLAQRRELWPIGFAAIFISAAIMTHPAMLLLLVCVCAAAILALWLAPHMKTTRITGLIRILGSAGIGLLISASWFIPFFSVRKSSTPYGTQWNNAEAMAQQLYGANIFPGTWAPITVLGVLGIVAMLASRRFFHTFIGLLVIIILTASSTTFLAQLHLTSLLDSLTFIQFQRFSMMLKPLWYILAVYGSFAILRHAVAALGRGGLEDQGQEQLDATPIRWREHGASLGARILLILTLCAPVLFHFGYHWGKKHLARNLTEESSRPYRSDRAEFTRWAKTNLEIAPNERARLMIVSSRHDHSFLDLATELDVPIYKPGFTPAATFKYKPERQDAALLEALNVRWILSVGRKQEKASYKYIRSFGRLHLYSFERWSPDPFSIISGEGDVETIMLDEELQVFEVKPGAHGMIRFNTSVFPRWTISRNGTPLDITTVRVNNNKKTGFMSTQLAPGTYRVEFNRTGMDHGSKVIGALALLLALLLLSTSITRIDETRPARFLKAIADVISQVERRYPMLHTSLGVFGVSAALIAAVLLAAWAPNVGKMHAPLEAIQDRDVVFDLLDNSSSATVFVERQGALRRCASALDMHICGHKAWEDVKPHAFVDENDKVWRRCIWAHPREKADLILEWKDIPTGSKLVGFYGVGLFGKSGSPVDIELAVNGERVLEGSTKRDGHFETIDVDLDGSTTSNTVQVRVRAKNTGKRHFCFNAQIIE